MDSNLGSSWSKWDLHIHSQYSLESICSLTIKAIFDFAIEKDIEVISVTDHTNFDGLDEIWELWETGKYKYPDSSEKLYKDIIQFIPGIELKAELGKRGVHFITLFPKEITIDDVVHKANKQFLIENYLSKINCSRADIIRAGKGDYSKGLLEHSVNFELAVKTARSLGGLIMVHNGTKDHGFDREIAHPSSSADEHELLNTLGEKKTDLMQNFIDICEFPSTSDYNKNEAAFYSKIFKKPSLVFSDSHHEFPGTHFTWIKGDKNIDGLRQTLYEKTRYCWPDKEPLLPLNRINELRINFPNDLKFRNEYFCYSGLKKDIFFSPYFTCLIGGRGTGKSSMLNLIHDCVTDYPPKLDITLNNRKIDVKDYVAVDVNAKIEYLSQNEIEGFAQDKQKLTDAIFTRLNSLYYASIEPANKLLSSSIQAIQTLLDNKIKLYRYDFDLAKKEKELQEKKKIIDSFSSDDYKSISSQIQRENELLQIKLASKNKFERLIHSLQEVINEFRITSTNNKYDEVISGILTSINLEIQKYPESSFIDIENEIQQSQQKISRLQGELTQYLAKRGLSQENMADVTRAASEIALIDGNILEIKTAISELNAEINSFDLDQQILNCNKYKFLIETNLNSINIDKLKQIESEYVKEINLEFEFNIINCQTEIFNKFKTLFQQAITDYKSNDNFDDSKLKEILTGCFDLNSTREQFINKVENYETQSKAKQFILYLFKFEALYEFFRLISILNYYNFEKFKLIKVTYGGREVQNTSFGQRCTAALVIILSLGNNPIIIDEPEAHLDSALISNYLVDLIKQNKRHRQIIFATHNANFVINGDAELIHYLSISSDNQTEIDSTTIENTKTRKELIALEGGIDAFKKREEKYRIIK
jgi:energy-coupling factor transporter ATP-binding protein EcfA2